MVDVKRRKLLARHLRHLAIGQITNDDYEELVARDVSYGWLPEQYHRSKEYQSDDPVIPLILAISWGLYNDTHQHNLKGEYAITAFATKEVARFILFLNTDAEHEWKPIPLHPLRRFSLKEYLLCIATLGQYYRIATKDMREQEEAARAEGDIEFWPFKTREKYEAALEVVPFLGGTRD